MAAESDAHPHARRVQEQDGQCQPAPKEHPVRQLAAHSRHILESGSVRGVNAVCNPIFLRTGSPVTNGQHNGRRLGHAWDEVAFYCSQYSLVSRVDAEPSGDDWRHRHSRCRGEAFGQLGTERQAEDRVYSASTPMPCHYVSDFEPSTIGHQTREIRSPQPIRRSGQNTAGSWEQRLDTARTLHDQGGLSVRKRFVRVRQERLERTGIRR